MAENDIGTLVAIAPGAPATNNQAGFEALSFTNIAGMVSVGELGDDQELITVPDLTIGRNISIKGAKTGTNIPINYRNVAGDAGQALVKSESDELRGESSLRVTDADGNVTYIYGPVTGHKRLERSITSYEGFTASIAVNNTPVEVSA